MPTDSVQPSNHLDLPFWRFKSLVASTSSSSVSLSRFSNLSSSLKLCVVCVCVILESSSLRFRLDLRPRLIVVTALDSHKPELDAAPPATPAMFVSLTPLPDCLVSLSRFKSWETPNGDAVWCTTSWPLVSHATHSLDRSSCQMLLFQEISLFALSARYPWSLYVSSNVNNTQDS